MESRKNLDQLDRVEVESRAELRLWLAENHRRAQSVWLITYKKCVGARHVPYSDIVDEALCVGWIDSLPRKLDDERTMLLLSPRIAGSAWSRINKDKVMRLIAEGLITEAGLAKIEQAKQDGAWDALNDVETLAIPDDLKDALAANQTASAYFERFPASSRRGILEWMSNAKQPEARAKRIAETVRLAERDIKANHPAGRNAGPKN